VKSIEFVEVEIAGTTGISPSGAFFRIGALLIALRPLGRVASRSKRATLRSPRERGSSAEQVEEIRADADNRTLRELAAEFRVSHETVPVA
jgi:hypothetical protein